jgi:outer membrane protein assembly factor BamB
VQQWFVNGPCEGGGGETPVVSRGKVYARTSDVPNEILNASTGKLLGTFQAGPPPAFDGQVGLFLNQGTLTAATDGTTLWSFAGDGGIDTAPIAVGSTVYISSSTGKLYGLALSTGKQVWSANVGSGVPGPEEQSAAQPLTGLGAGQGLVVVPAGDRLVAYSG